MYHAGSRPGLCSFQPDDACEESGFSPDVIYSDNRAGNLVTMAAEGDGAVALSRRTAEYCIEKTGAGVRAESGNGKGAAIVDIEPGINIYMLTLQASSTKCSTRP